MSSLNQTAAEAIAAPKLSLDVGALFLSCCWPRWSITSIAPT